MNILEGIEMITSVLTMIIFKRELIVSFGMISQWIILSSSILWEWVMTTIALCITTKMRSGKMS